MIPKYKRMRVSQQGTTMKRLRARSVNQDQISVGCCCYSFFSTVESVELSSALFQIWGFRQLFKNFVCFLKKTENFRKKNTNIKKKKLKLTETSKNYKTHGVFFPAREARREFFFECTFCRAARQVQVQSAPTKKLQTLHTISWRCPFGTSPVVRELNACHNHRSATLRIRVFLALQNAHAHLKRVKRFWRRDKWRDKGRETAQHDGISAKSTTGAPTTG